MPTIIRRFSVWIVAAIASLASAHMSVAQGLIRDAEIERTLKLVAKPILKSAGLGSGSLQVLVVDDRTLNAFVVNGRYIFVHSGLITRLPTSDMLQAVLSHEIAHITSGHLIQRGLAQQNAASAAGLGLLLSLAVASTGNTQAATGLAIGTSSAARRSLLAHTRAQESTADQVGARYLARANVNPKAALEVLEIFRGQEALSIGRQDPYVLTHPLSQQRIRALKGQVAAFGDKPTKTTAKLAYWHSRMVAKFNGFNGNPSAALRKVKNNDRSEPAILLRAIAYHRLANEKKALKNINALLAKRPNDGFYHELKGQILLESGKAANAVASYKRAVALEPKESLILAGYGRALLAQKSKSSIRAALSILKKARRIDPRDARMLRDLAVAYASTGNNGMASLVTAERYALLTRFRDAQTHATRASGLLPRGSSGWLRAQDVLSTSKIALR